MTRSRKTLVCVLGSLALCTGAYAITSTDNPYAALVDRNVFGLKPPPPPPDPNEVKKEPPPNIFLTGITTIFGNKRALLKTTPKTAGKPGEQKEQTFMLTEGQRDGDIEVVSIDEKAGKVVIKLEGNETTLDFEKNAPKIVATPTPTPGIPGMPVPPPMSPAMPGLTPVSKPFSPGAGSITIPSRTLRLPGSAGTMGSPNPMQPNTSMNGGMGAQYAGIPGGAVPVANAAGPSFFGNTPVGSTTVSQAAVPDHVYSAEEQHILIEAARQRNDPFASMLPPTALNPTANLQQTPGGQQTQQGAGSTGSGSTPSGPGLPLPPGGPGFLPPPHR